jgi:hypothetical protein
MIKDLVEETAEYRCCLCFIIEITPNVMRTPSVIEVRVLTFKKMVTRAMKSVKA